MVPNPYIQYQTGSGYTYYCPNSSGGAVTVTVSNPTNPTGMDLAITEVHGVAALNPLYSSTFGQTWITGSTTTQTTSNLILPTGTYYLYSTLGDRTQTYPYQYGQSSPFIVHNNTYSSYSSQYIRQTADETVNAGTYSSTTTSSNGTGFLRSWVGLAAFSTVNFVGPQIVQSMVGGNACCGFILNKKFALPVQAGSHLLVFANWAGNLGCTTTSTAPTLSDSLGNTWTKIKGGTATDWFGLYLSGASGAGADTLALSCQASGSQGLSMLELSGVTAVDVANSNQLSSATSNTDGGITTSHAYDYVVSFGEAASATCAGDAQFPAPPTGTVTSWRNFSNSACTQFETFDLLEPNSGTSLSNTYTTPSSWVATAAIVALTPSSTPGGGSASPSVQIITKMENKDELWKAFWEGGQ